MYLILMPDLFGVAPSEYVMPLEPNVLIRPPSLDLLFENQLPIDSAICLLKINYEENILPFW